MYAADRTFVIAEAGVNHNGSIDLALELVDIAARAGADAVKFQMFRSELLVSGRASKAAYQARNTGKAGSQLDLLRSLELSNAEFRVIAKHCESRGIVFLSTAFDLESLHFLADLAVPAVKIPSGDATAAPLVLEAARLSRPLIVSTGMCTLTEIEETLGVIAFGLLQGRQRPCQEAFSAAYKSEWGREALKEKVTLLHCVTDYPAPARDVNLRAMGVLRDAFGLRVGYSDHTLGKTVALAAVALGACVLEKHFTTDPALPGPDHGASLTPVEMTSLIEEIRQVEIALGTARKEPTVSEVQNRVSTRRSLVTARAVKKGELFTESNLTFKRPGDGIPPILYWELLGSPAKRAYAADELVEP